MPPDVPFMPPDSSIMPPDSSMTIADAPPPDADIKLDAGMPDSGMTMTAVLRVEPDTLAFPQTAVLATANPSLPITIYTDAGAQLANVVVDFGTSVNASQWSASACAATPCALAPFSSTQVDIQFDPTSHGVKDVTLTATSANGGSDTVLLTGTGLGGVLSVRDP